MSHVMVCVDQCLAVKNMKYLVSTQNENQACEKPEQVGKF